MTQPNKALAARSAAEAQIRQATADRDEALAEQRRVVARHMEGAASDADIATAKASVDRAEAKLEFLHSPQGPLALAEARIAEREAEAAALTEADALADVRALGIERQACLQDIVDRLRELNDVALRYVKASQTLWEKSPVRLTRKDLSAVLAGIPTAKRLLKIVQLELRPLYHEACESIPTADTNLDRAASRYLVEEANLTRLFAGLPEPSQPKATTTTNAAAPETPAEPVVSMRLAHARLNENNRSARARGVPPADDAA